MRMLHAALQTDIVVLTWRAKLTCEKEFRCGILRLDDRSFELDKV